MVSLECEVGGVHLDCCVFNASGPRTGSWEALAKIEASASGAVLAKSATLKAQTGNDLPRTWQGSAASLNSEGLPNKGIDYYLSDDSVGAATKRGKPYIISISGKNLESNLEMLERASLVDGVSAIELNLACPNIIGHPIIAYVLAGWLAHAPLEKLLSAHSNAFSPRRYDFEQMAAVLAAVQAQPAASRKPLGIKMPPYFDMPHFQQAASILNRFSCVSYVASINTMGNSLAIDAEAEQPEIRPKGGFGGRPPPSHTTPHSLQFKFLREED